MKFNWKKINRWKIDFYTYEVLLVDKLPKKYTKGEKKSEKISGICDTESKKIYICRKENISPATLLEDLFHELEHAIDHAIAIDMHLEIISTTTDEEQEELFLDLRVELRAMKRLTMMYDNRSNYQYILDWFRSQQTNRR